MANAKDKQQSDRTWLWIGLAVIALAAFLFYQYQSSKLFAVTSGDDGSVLVLLRGTKEVSFQVDYKGDAPASISQIQLKLITGPDVVVHTDVDEMRLVIGENQVVLDKEGNVIGGDQFVLQPNDTFEIQMKLFGRTLGINRLESIYIHFERNGQKEFFELPLSDTIFSVE